MMRREGAAHNGGGSSPSASFRRMGGGDEGGAGGGTSLSPEWSVPVRKSLEGGGGIGDGTSFVGQLADDLREFQPPDALPLLPPKQTRMLGGRGSVVDATGKKSNSVEYRRGGSNPRPLLTATQQLSTDSIFRPTRPPGRCRLMTRSLNVPLSSCISTATRI